MPNIKEELKRLETYIEAQQEEMVRFLTAFIAKESVTYHEQDAAAFLKGKMEEFGFDEVRVDQVGNVLGRVGSGKTVLLYDAHIDTVEPGDAADWGFDPLSAKIEDGVIHGRGAVDDKGPAHGGGVCRARAQGTGARQNVYHVGFPAHSPRRTWKAPPCRR